METPKKVAEANRCLICSTVVAKKEKLYIFGKSSIDFCEIKKSALNVIVRNFSASEQLFSRRAQCYQRLTKFKRALDNLKKQKVNWRRCAQHRTKRLCKDDHDAEGDVAKGVDKHVDCTSKTRAVIGRFPIARTVSGYANQILIGHIWERNVVRKKAAVCGEERCVTSLKTVAKETRGFETHKVCQSSKQNTLPPLPTNMFLTTQILGGHVTSRNQGLSSNEGGREERPWERHWKL